MSVAIWNTRHSFSIVWQFRVFEIVVSETTYPLQRASNNKSNIKCNSTRYNIYYVSYQWNFCYFSNIEQSYRFWTRKQRNTRLKHMEYDRLDCWLNWPSGIIIIYFYINLNKINNFKVEYYTVLRWQVVDLWPLLAVPSKWQTELQPQTFLSTRTWCPQYDVSSLYLIS